MWTVVALLGATASGSVAPAQAQVPASGETATPPSQAEAVTALSDRVARATAAVAAVQKQQADVAAQLQAGDADIARIQASVGSLQRTSSEAVAAARQEALASYMHSDTAGQALALATAVSQGDVNDVAWSLGILKVTHDHSLGVLKAASTAAGTASQQLTAALARRAELAGEADRLAAALTQAQADLTAAESDLASTVKQLASTVADGMTTVAYDAYQHAAAEVATEMPTCGLRWELLSAIGKTESNHGSGRLDAKGDSVIPIIGIPIGPDTDGGVLDLDPTADHAVGPMQFIPSTWRTSGADGNGDGVADPNNIFDEALAAARYLCRAAGSLTLLTRDGVVRAILSYNPNMQYLQVVGARFEALASDVAQGWFSQGDLPVPTAQPAPADNADGGHAPSDAAFTPPGTDVRTLTVFGPNGLSAPSSGDVLTATCAAPSAVLAGRPGFVRCAPTPAGPVLDPCAVSPSDPTLVACVTDPEQPVRLVRATTAQPIVAPAAAPPYLELILSGGDVCRPVAPPGSPGPPTPTQAAPTDTPTTTTTAPSVGSAPGTTTTTSAAATTTTTTTTAVPAPTAPGATYFCASGASVVGQPNTATAAWTVTINQPGAPTRTLTVATAWN